MSDVGLFPPGGMLWLAALALLAAATAAAIGAALFAWAMAYRRNRPISRERFFGYALGAGGCAAASGASMWLADQHTFPQVGHWADQQIVFYGWMAVLLACGPVIAWRWNGRSLARSVR